MAPEMMARTDDGQMMLQAVAEAVCKHLPEGWELNICMEKGAASVELYDPIGLMPHDFDPCPDLSLEEQINEALCWANGWRT